MEEVPAFFERNSCLIDCLVLGLLPFDLKVCLAYRSRCYILHVVDTNLLCYQVRLLQSSLIVVVYIPIYHTELT